jgi:hypothetical protein
MTDVGMVLAVLQRSRGEWVPKMYLQTGVMVHSRVADLRRAGYTIECRCFGRGDYRYRLTGGPHEKTD